MTRRPGSDPDLLVSSVDRDTWQGMANARVPSAFPIDRFRIPDPQRRPPDAAVPFPSIIQRIKHFSGFTGGHDGSYVVTLVEGDAAMVVIWGTPVDAFSIPSGWTTHEVFTSTNGFGGTRYCVASITGAAAGSYVFGWDVPGTPSIQGITLAGHLLRNAGGGPVGGTWAYTKGTIRQDRRSFKFQTPDPSWDIWWQESFCSGVYTGLEDVPPVLPTGSGRPGFSGGEGSATDSYQWPRSEVLDHYLAGEPYQAPAPTEEYVDGGFYAFGNIGAYGQAGSVPMTFGWTP